MLDPSSPQVVPLPQGLEGSREIQLEDVLRARCRTAGQNTFYACEIPMTRRRASSCAPSVDSRPRQVRTRACCRRGAPLLSSPARRARAHGCVGESAVGAATFRSRKWRIVAAAPAYVKTNSRASSCSTTLGRSTRRGVRPRSPKLILACVPPATGRALDPAPRDRARVCRFRAGSTSAVRSPPVSGARVLPRTESAALEIRLRRATRRAISCKTPVSRLDDSCRPDARTQSVKRGVANAGSRRSHRGAIGS